MGNTLKKDNDHLAAFRRNDQRVMQHVYRNIFPKFRSHVQKNSGNETLAKDVFQEAFITCWRNIKDDKLEKNSNVEAYLFTIAKNKWVDYLRSSDFKKTVPTDSFSTLKVVQEANEVDEEVKASHRLALRTALGQLGNNCRQLLELFYFERKSMHDISEKLNITSASAKNQKYRCMQNLRALSLELQNNG